MNTTAETYPTIEAAVADLQMLCGMIVLGQQRRELRELITSSGLSRRYVADLATEIVTELTPHSVCDDQAPPAAALSGDSAPVTGCGPLPAAG